MRPDNTHSRVADTFCLLLTLMHVPVLPPCLLCPVTVPQVTAAQLFQQAQVALRFDDFDAAKQALRQAVKLEPGNGALLDAYACLLAELGDDAAEEVLKQVRGGRGLHAGSMHAW